MEKLVNPAGVQFEIVSFDKAGLATKDGVDVGSTGKTNILNSFFSGQY